jgi:hypothetical protein
VTRVSIPPFVTDVAATASSIAIVGGLLLWLVKPRWEAYLRRFASLEKEVHTNGHKSRKPTMRDNVDTALKGVQETQELLEETRADMDAGMGTVCLWMARSAEELRKLHPDVAWPEPPPEPPRRASDPADVDWRDRRDRWRR